MTDPDGATPTAAWAAPLSDPAATAGAAVDALVGGALTGDSGPGALRREADAAARRALRKHLDSLAKTALTAALAGEAGQTLQRDTVEALAGVLDGDPDPTAPPAPREPMFPNVADWLHGYLLPNYRRPLLHNRWCRRWWEHAEAISRLEAIWQAWEAMRYDGATGLAVWWRDYADPHMRVLLDEAGRFFDCDAARDQHKPRRRCPSRPRRPGCSAASTTKRNTPGTSVGSLQHEAVLVRRAAPGLPSTPGSRAGLELSASIAASPECDHDEMCCFVKTGMRPGSLCEWRGTARGHRPRATGGRGQPA